jgi:hypothetical protein
LWIPPGNGLLFFCQGNTALFRQAASQVVFVLSIRIPRQPFRSRLSILMLTRGRMLRELKGRGAHRFACWRCTARAHIERLAKPLNGQPWNAFHQVVPD